MTGENVRGVRYNLSMHPLRLAAVPDAAPPYDCQVHASTCGAIPDRPADSSAPADREAAAELPVSYPPPPQPRPSGGADPAWLRPFVQAIVEALAGARPLRQVAGSATERVCRQIEQLLATLRSDSGARVRRVMTSRTDERVVEVTVIAGFGPRTRALAMRFEHVPARQAVPGLPPRPARWLCTDLATP
jgi:hypothetical protein